MTYAFALTAVVSGASAATYVPGTPVSFCSGEGTGAGECGEIRGVAVDTSVGAPTSGHLYVVDQGNNRVDEFAPDGTFVRAFGDGVLDGTEEAQVCTTATGCLKGKTTGTTLGAFGTAARGIAVDPASHVVYVATAAARLAYYDGTTGAFIGQTEGNVGQINAGAPERFGNVTGVAVDSSDPLQQYLYVSIRINTGTSGKIDKFRIDPSGVAAGSYVCQITGTAADTSLDHSECGGSGLATHKDGAFEGLDPGAGPAISQQGGNIAVDHEGNLVVLEATGSAVGNPALYRQVVSVFDRDGDYVTQFKPVVSAEHATEPRPEAVAIPPNGNVLVADDGPVAGQGGSVVQEFDLTAIPPAIPPAIASATPISEFGRGTIGSAAVPAGGSVGIAGDVSSGIYVGDKNGRKVWKFTPVATPPVSVTEPATGISKATATLHGKVNAGFAAVSDCHFDYGPTASYGQTIPCEGAPSGGGAAVPVKATVGGLTPETGYHFRIVATNANGTDEGDDAQFTTLGKSKPVVVTTPGATEVVQDSARVAGTVNPNEIEITNCQVEYGPTTAYGSSANCASLPPDCTAAPGSGIAPVGVCAVLTGLTPKTVYHFRFIAENGDGLGVGGDQTFETLPAAPSVTTGAATEVGQVAARVSGLVNPNSGTVASCRVDYGPTTAYGSSANCAAVTPSCSASPGSGATPVGVCVTLSGLNPGVLYHYRFVATNVGGVGMGSDGTFLTLPASPPDAATFGASEGPEGTYSLEGRVNPKGLSVDDCHFAYGATPAYGQVAPCLPSAGALGSGSSELTVSASTKPLEPNTTYHFRLIASSIRGGSQGRDRTFTTGAGPGDGCPNADIRASQGREVMLLPDCLALEQVSPAKKANQGARLPEALTADGARVLFTSIATLGNCPNVNAIGGDFFIGSRDPSPRWDIECANPQITDQVGSGLKQFSFTPDLSHWIQFISGEGGPRFVREGFGGSLRALSPQLINLAGVGNPRFIGASSDQLHLYFVGEGGAYFLPGDPVTAGPGSTEDTYVTDASSAGTPTLGLLARDGNGKVWGGNCGAVLGDQGITQGAISHDGSRAYFSTRPSQPSSGDCTAASGERIMTRRDTASGPVIEELISDECNRAAPAPPCSGADGDDRYRGASVDQSKVYFLSSRQLANSDRDTTPDLYLYDSSRPAGQRLTQVSAGEVTATHSSIGSGALVSNVSEISRDGTHAYFISPAALTSGGNAEGEVAEDGQNNLYLYTTDDNALHFIASLGSGAVERSYAVPVTRRDSSGAEVGGDGHILVFGTQARLTADDTNNSRDLYRYDADSGSLVRVSRPGAGGFDPGESDVEIARSFSGEEKGRTDFSVKDRVVSDDGRTVVFTTGARLLPGDTNGIEDSYMWHDGRIYHLPGSARTVVVRILPVISSDGSTISYQSVERLLPSDGDSVEDVYVLRTDGGSRVAERSVCEGEACQGAPEAPNAGIDEGTSSFLGVGNVRATPARKCPRGKHRQRVRGKGKFRCVKRHGHRKHKKGGHGARRNSHRHGGQK